MSASRILVAGIGNIFLGDDAFGVEVAQRLARRALPAGVRVIDFGIRGLDLTYALLDGYHGAILVDAVPRGGPPGTLYVIEPEIDDAAGEVTVEGHGMDPAKVLRAARALGSATRPVLLVGCDPHPPADEDDMQMGLSEPVAAAVDQAVGLVESLIGQMLGEAPQIETLETRSTVGGSSACR
jgi:hydrogenase maturation protease